MVEEVSVIESGITKTIDQTVDRIIPEVSLIDRLVSKGRLTVDSFWADNPQLVRVLQVIDHRLTWLEKPERSMPRRRMFQRNEGFRDLLLRRGYLSDTLLRPLLARFNAGRQYPSGPAFKDFVVFGEEKVEDIAKRLAAHRDQNRRDFDATLAQVERTREGTRQIITGFIPELQRIGIASPTQNELLLAYTWYQHSKEPREEYVILQSAREKEYYSAASRLVPDDGRRLMVQIAVDRTRKVPEPPRIFKAEDGAK